MTTHEEALEAAAKAYRNNSMGDGPSIERLNRAITTYLSSLSPEVGGLCERLRSMRHIIELQFYPDENRDILEAADMLAALSAKLRAVERTVEVKALDWAHHHSNYPTWTAPLYVFRFAAVIDQGEAHVYGKFPLKINGRMSKEKHDTLEDAKTAAQLEFENRVQNFLCSVLVDMPIDITRARAEEAEAENVRLREALKPFAERAGKLDGIWKDHETQWSPEYGNTAITIGDLRAASLALTGVKAERGNCKVNFLLEWVSGARPPVHPNPMTGRTTFKTFEEASKHMRNMAPDARFVFLEERRTVSIDRSDDLRAALATRKD